MSEHTSVFMTKIRFEDQLKRLGISAFRRLNEEWLVFMGPVEEREQEMIELSKELPILYITHAEDYGWGYMLWANGELKAEFEYSYMLSEEALMDVLESEYPDADPQELLYGDAGDRAEAVNELIGQFYSGGAYEKLLRETFKTANFDALAVLDLEEERIEALKATITYQGQEMIETELVENFLAIMNLKELSWLGVRQ